MDTYRIPSAYVLAGDSKYRLSSREEKGQSPTISFVYFQPDDQIFLHLDGEFSHSRTGYYLRSNSIELFLDLHRAQQLNGLLKNIVAPTEDPGPQPATPTWNREADSLPPAIIEEYTTRCRAITIDQPLGLILKPRTREGFTLYTSLARPRNSKGEMLDYAFRLKFWLTERAIPTLQLLQNAFTHSFSTRTQQMHIVFTFDPPMLSLLQRQLEVLIEHYPQENA